MKTKSALLFLAIGAVCMFNRKNVSAMGKKIFTVPDFSVFNSQRIVHTKKVVIDEGFTQDQISCLSRHDFIVVPAGTNLNNYAGTLQASLNAGSYDITFGAPFISPGRSVCVSAPRILTFYA